MPISAIIPAASVVSANAALESAGYGPDSFSVGVSSNPDEVTHYGLHSWDNAGLLAVLNGLSFQGLEIRSGVSSGEFGPATIFVDQVIDSALAWEGAERWYVNPIMTGDERTFDSTLWRSTMDYNVWAPPIGWREIVADGYPSWVQPVSTNAYAINERVYHANPNDGGLVWVYESNIEANTTEPGQDGTFDRWWEPVERVAGQDVDPEPTTPRWAQGGGTGTAGSYNVGDEVIWDRPQDGGNDWLFRSKIPANTTQPGRDATFDRWWEPVRAV